MNQGDVVLLVAAIRLCTVIVATFGTVIAALVVRVLLVQHGHTVTLAAVKRHLGIEIDETGAVRELGVVPAMSTAERKS